MFIVVIHFCDRMWSFGVEANLCRFFLIVCVYMLCRLTI